MPFVLLAVGILFFVVAIQGTQGSFFTLMKSEFTGSNSFVVWAAAFIIIGLIGYSRPLKPVSHAFLVLILVAMILANGKGVFANFQSALANPVAPAATGTGSSMLASNVSLLTSPATQTQLPQVY